MRKDDIAEIVLGQLRALLELLEKSNPIARTELAKRSPALIQAQWKIHEGLRCLGPYEYTIKSTSLIHALVQAYPREFLGCKDDDSFRGFLQSFALPKFGIILDQFELDAFMLWHKYSHNLTVAINAHLEALGF